MSEPRVVGAAELRRLLPMADAVGALEEAFRRGTAHSPRRMRLEVAGGELLVMPAADRRGIGVKLVTVAPANPGRGLPLVQAAYLLFAPGTLEPLAVIDGAELTALRTAAVSGLATKYLAPPDARRLMIFGAGVQATAHLNAMLAVRPVEQVTVCSRTKATGEKLVERALARGVRASLAPPEAVADADLVCTCTTSAAPLFAGAALAPGAHVNAVGAHTVATRELDDETIRRARSVVEDRTAALAEAGEVVIPLRAGLISESHIVADLAEVVAGATVRRRPQDVTVFKSVGIASEDLAVANALMDRLGRVSR